MYTSYLLSQHPSVSECVHALCVCVRVYVHVCVGGVGMYVVAAPCTEGQHCGSAIFFIPGVANVIL